MKSIYLDYAATTPIDPFVLKKMNEAATDCYANPSSMHKAGQKSKVLLEESRQQVAASIGALPSEIIFTSGGSEANNLALLGAVHLSKKHGRHIISTTVEHPSVLEPLQKLTLDGCTVSYLDINQDGYLDHNQIDHFIQEDTSIISVMLVNNETGNIFPVHQIKAIVDDRPILLHCDAVQGLDKTEFSVHDLGVDLLTLSAHKIYGPKGCGALYVRQGTQISKMIHGGSQEVNRRAGTENLSAIVGFAEAIRQMKYNKENRQKISNLRDLFETTLIKEIPDIRINGVASRRVPHISNIYFPFLSGESLLMNLDLRNIAVSIGSACSSGSLKPSHVLAAMGYPHTRVKNSLRFSFGRQTKKKDIYHTIRAIMQIWQQKN